MDHLFPLTLLSVLDDTSLQVCWVSLGIMVVTESVWPLLLALCFVGFALHYSRGSAAAHGTAPLPPNTVLPAMDDAPTVLAADGTIRSLSGAAAELLGYPPLALVGLPAHTIVHHDDYPHLLERLATLRRVPLAALPAAEWRLRHSDGSWRMLEITLVNAFDDPRWNGCIVRGRDLTESKAWAARLNHHTDHDDLTGLANRRGFTRRLDQAVAQSSSGFTVMFLEIDRFSTINDSLGHTVGDAVLREIGVRLQAAVHADDMVARMGSDEFMVFLANVQQPAAALASAKQLQSALAQPFWLDDVQIYLSTSVGMTIADDPAQTADSLLREADTAVHQAKMLGLSQYVLFDRASHAQIRARLQLEIDLRGALERAELALVYQPIMDLPTGETVGMEALLRWHHPKHGIILPSDFISLAEDSGLIVPIGLWTLEQACRQFQVWHDGGAFASLRSISVNLSAKQFANAQLVGNIATIIEQTGIAPQHLELEITETVVMVQVEHAVATLRQLKALGVQLAIDDFGTGYSSLSYLHSFPLDTLKVDRSFVSAMHGDYKRSEIVRTIIAMSQHLAMSVIAEGIETIEQAAALRDMGCEYGQGYHFARPLEAIHMLSWIKERELNDQRSLITDQTYIFGSA